MSQLSNKLFYYIAICGMVLSLLIIQRLIYNIFFHPLKKYPGPKTWAATRLFWAQSMQAGNYHHRLHQFHEQYGPVVRVAPNELSYIRGDAWKEIYLNQNIPKNRTWAGQEEEKHPMSIVSTDESTHLRNRRALAGAFTEHAVKEHASVLESMVALMAQQFKAAAEVSQGQTTIDIVDWLNFLTFDISSILSFGESFDCVKNGRPHPWVEISCGFGKGIAIVASINFFRPFDRLMKLAMPKKIMEKMKYHKQISHEKFEQRLKEVEKSNKHDYVESIQAYNDEKGEIRIPQNEIEANLTLLIFAGAETTSTAMTSILNHLLQCETARQKAEAEIRSAFRDVDDITISSVTHLEYLSAVIQEGIRMGPPAAISIPRIVPQGGAIILGEHVAAGTFISVNQYPTFRSASNFTSPDSFIPERFLSDTPFPRDQLDVFEPFLLGRHKCIGQKLAWAIMRMTLARLLFEFDMKFVEGPQDFGEQKTFIFWEKKPVKVDFCIRTKT